MKSFIDRFITTPEAIQRCTAGVEFFTVVQLPPCKVPSFPVGGRAVARMKEGYGVSFKCDYFRTPPKIKLYKKGGPGVRSSFLAEFKDTTWRLISVARFRDGTISDTFTEFLNTRGDF